MPHTPKIPISLYYDIWDEVEPIIIEYKKALGRKHNSDFLDNRSFINQVLLVLSETDRFSPRLKWSIVSPENAKYSDKLRKRFERWRKDGVWEQILPILAQHEEFYDLFHLGQYALLLKNHKLTSSIFSSCSKFYKHKQKQKTKERIKNQKQKEVEKKQKRAKKEAERKKHKELILAQFDEDIATWSDYEKYLPKDYFYAKKIRDDLNNLKKHILELSDMI